MSLKQRPYQIDTIRSLRSDYDSGLNRLGVNLATGLGKTSAVAAFLPEEFPELAEHGLVFLSHRREILMQAYNTFKEKWGKEKWIGLEMGEYHCTGEEDFMFISVDSIGRVMGNRIAKFKHRWPGIVIADEGHHVCEDGTWSNILNFFGVGDDHSQFHTFPNGSKPLSVFLSATFVRSDGQALAPWLDKISASYDILWAMKNGWLCDIKSYHPVLTSHDYKKFDHEQQVDYLVKVFDDYGLKDMRTLAFAKNVAQSVMLANTLTERGYCTAGHIDAKTPDEIRQDLVRRFALDYGKKDEINLLSNRLIFTEGYDNPMIDCILDNAPTESQTLYIQKIGRGLRVDPSVDLGSYETVEERKEAIRLSRKPFLTYITAFPIKHGLDMPATLFGLPKDVDVGDKMLSEVIDLIIYEEEIMPEAPVRDLAGMSSLEITLKRQDIWTQTIYNEDVKALSSLRWIIGEDYAALRLVYNPFSKKPDEQTPVIVSWSRTADNRWSLSQIIEGGWSLDLHRPVRPQIHDMNHIISDLNSGIQQVDQWIKKNDMTLYATMQREHSGPAGRKHIDYLKRKKISANYDQLTLETAKLLKDYAIIQPKLEKFGLPFV